MMNLHCAFILLKKNPRECIPLAMRHSEDQPRLSWVSICGSRVGKELCGLPFILTQVRVLKAAWGLSGNGF